MRSLHSWYSPARRAFDGRTRRIRDARARGGRRGAERRVTSGAFDLGPGLRADPLHRGPAVGRRRRQARPGARHLLAHRHRPLLLAVGDRRGVAQPRDAARRRALPVGEARLQRVGGVHRRLEPLAVRHPEHDEHRASVHAVPGLHLRTARRRAHGAELGDLSDDGDRDRRAGLDHGGRAPRRQVGAHRRWRPYVGDLRK